MNLSPKDKQMLGNAKSYIATVSRRAEIAKDMGLAHALSDVVASLHTIMTTRGSVVRPLGRVLNFPNLTREE